jgi:two-component sensor histidine kinase
MQDITERKQAERRIEASLREKTVLLQEVHHRVKINMQVISSLLDMQTLQAEDPQIVQILQDSQNRIRAMASVHDRLYQSPDLATIDLVGYIQALAHYLFGIYTFQSAGVDLCVQIDDVSLGLDQAVPLGLIVNELVSNSLKHAFPSGGTRGGEIRIELHPRGEGWLALVVSDNGVGLAPDVDLETVSSLGLRLVSMLTQQLRGTLALDRTGGTTFCITFADPRSNPGREAGP